MDMRIAVDDNAESEPFDCGYESTKSSTQCGSFYQPTSFYKMSTETPGVVGKDPVVHKPILPLPGSICEKTSKEGVKREKLKPVGEEVDELSDAELLEAEKSVMKSADPELEAYRIQAMRKSSKKTVYDNKSLSKIYLSPNAAIHINRFKGQVYTHIRTTKGKVTLNEDDMFSWFHNYEEIKQQWLRKTQVDDDVDVHSGTMKQARDDQEGGQPPVKKEKIESVTAPHTIPSTSYYSSSVPMTMVNPMLTPKPLVQHLAPAAAGGMVMTPYGSTYSFDYRG